jgi:hypothetical protein
MAKPAIVANLGTETVYLGPRRALVVGAAIAAIAAGGARAATDAPTAAAQSRRRRELRNFDVRLVPPASDFPLCFRGLARNIRPKYSVDIRLKPALERV